MDQNEYTVRVEASNPEYATDAKLKNGIKCGGFVGIYFEDRKAKASTVLGVSVHQLAEYFAQDDQTTNILRQAMAIADGMRRADEIMKKDQGGIQSAKSFLEMLMRK